MLSDEDFEIIEHAEAELAPQPVGAAISFARPRQLNSFFSAPVATQDDSGALPAAPKQQESADLNATPAEIDAEPFIETDSTAAHPPSPTPDLEVDEDVDDDALAVAFLQDKMRAIPTFEQLVSGSRKEGGKKGSSARPTPGALVPLFLVLIGLGLVRLASEGFALAAHESSAASRPAYVKTTTTTGWADAPHPFAFESALDLAAGGAKPSPVALAAASRAVLASARGAHLRKLAARTSDEGGGNQHNESETAAASSSAASSILLASLGGFLASPRPASSPSLPPPLPWISRLLASDTYSVPAIKTVGFKPTPASEAAMTMASTPRPLVAKPAAVVTADMIASRLVLNAASDSAHTASSASATATGLAALTKSSISVGAKSAGFVQALAPPSATKAKAQPTHTPPLTKRLQSALAITKLLQAKLGKHGTSLEEHARKQEIERLVAAAAQKESRDKALIIPTKNAGASAVAGPSACVSPAPLKEAAAPKKEQPMPTAITTTTTNSVNHVRVAAPCRGVACVLAPIRLNQPAPPQYLVPKAPKRDVTTAPQVAASPTADVHCSNASAPEHLDALAAPKNAPKDAPKPLRHWHQAVRNVSDALMRGGISFRGAVKFTGGVTFRLQPASGVSSKPRVNATVTTTKAAAPTPNATPPATSNASARPFNRPFNATMAPLFIRQAPKLLPPPSLRHLLPPLTMTRLALFGASTAPRHSATALQKALLHNFIMRMHLTDAHADGHAGAWRARHPRFRHQLLAPTGTSSNASDGWDSPCAALTTYLAAHLADGNASALEPFNASSAQHTKPRTCGGLGCLPAPKRTRVHRLPGGWQPAGLLSWAGERTFRALVTRDSVECAAIVLTLYNLDLHVDLHVGVQVKPRVHAAKRGAAKRGAAKKIGSNASAGAATAQGCHRRGGNTSHGFAPLLPPGALPALAWRMGGTRIAASLLSRGLPRSKSNASSSTTAASLLSRALPPPGPTPSWHLPMLGGSCQDMAREAAHAAARRTFERADEEIARANTAASRSENAAAAAARAAAELLDEIQALHAQLGRSRGLLKRKEAHVIQVESVLGATAEREATALGALKEHEAYRAALEKDLREAREAFDTYKRVEATARKRLEAEQAKRLEEQMKRKAAERKLTRARKEADEAAQKRKAAERETAARVAKAEKDAEARRQQAARLAELHEKTTRREVAASRKVVRLTERVERLAEELSLLKHKRRIESAGGERAQGGGQRAANRSGGGGGGAHRHGKKREYWRREMAKAKGKEQAKRHADRRKHAAKAAAW